MSTKNKLELPEPMGIKPLEIDTTSIYLRWAVLSSHGLSKEQLKNLQFEIRTTDNKLNADCLDNSPSHEYKARLCGLSENKKYRFQIRSRLKLKSNKIITSGWSHRIEITTRKQMDHFVIISDEKELEVESLKHRLRKTMSENKKLQLQIEQLQVQLNESPKKSTPGHWQWNYKKIVNWIMRIQDGAFKEYKKELTKVLKEEGITGKDLVMVDEGNLKEWGINNFSLRKLLLQYITRLTENDKPPQIKFDPKLTQQLSNDIDENIDQNEPKEEQLIDIKEDIEVPKQELETETDEQPKTDEKDLETDEKNEEDIEPELPSRVAGISQSIQELLASKSSEQKVWKYKEGMLSVQVLRASNVDNLDKNNLSAADRGGSDAYVELDLKGNYKKEKTKAIDNSENPIWNERFQLFVDDPKDDVLKCTLYDHDKWTMDEKIGSVQIPIITILGANGHIRKEYEVIGSKSGCKLELDLKYWESSR